MDLRERTENAARHPWELARADFFSRLIVAEERNLPISVLDIGAGDAFFAGHLLAQLPAHSSVTCVDPSYTDSWLGTQIQEKGRKLICSREVPPQSFDWITLLDVLEHVEDPHALLRDQVVPRLSSDGQVLISVPAWQALYTGHDTQLGHLRRYSPSQLLAQLDQVDLNTSLNGGLFSSLLLPRTLEKLAELLRGHRAKPERELDGHVETEVGTWSMGKWPTSIIRSALHWDGLLGLQAARLSLHLPGLSTWAIAKKQA